jgi:hypothetical protein
VVHRSGRILGVMESQPRVFLSHATEDKERFVLAFATFFDLGALMCGSTDGRCSRVTVWSTGFSPRVSDVHCDHRGAFEGEH